MTTSVRDRIEKQSNETLRACMSEYAALEETGRLPDECALRRLCLECSEGAVHSMSLWFEVVIKEVFRHYAYRYVSLLD